MVRPAGHAPDAGAGLLDGPGVVKELNFGTYILLRPEWINAYAQAVIRTLRAEAKSLGCLRVQYIAGKLIFQIQQAMSFRSGVTLSGWAALPVS